jgi:hypothetical protein
MNQATPHKKDLPRNLPMEFSTFEDRFDRYDGTKH